MQTSQKQDGKRPTGVQALYSSRPDKASSYPVALQFVLSAFPNLALTFNTSL